MVLLNGEEFDNGNRQEYDIRFVVGDQTFRPALSRGWKLFREAYPIAASDTLVFEYIEGEYLFLVHILRAGEVYADRVIARLNNAAVEARQAGQAAPAAAQAENAEEDPQDADAHGHAPQAAPQIADVPAVAEPDEEDFILNRIETSREEVLEHVETRLDAAVREELSELVEASFDSLSIDVRILVQQLKARIPPQE